MRTSLVAATAFSVATALVAVSVAGCGNHSKSSTATSGSAASTSAGHSATPTDYARLLIKAEDINAPEPFTASPPTQNPDGKEGVTTTFRNDDGSHVIIDTILILPDPAAATAALDAAKATLPGSAAGKTNSVKVGSGGTTVFGDTPDGSKGITMLRFTQGRAFVTLEFDGPTGIPAPPDFVTDVGQKQDAAIKSGLPG